MTVAELREMLEDYDDDAVVVVGRDGQLVADVVEDGTVVEPVVRLMVD